MDCNREKVCRDCISVFPYNVSLGRFNKTRKYWGWMGHISFCSMRTVNKKTEGLFVAKDTGLEVNAEKRRPGFDPGSVHVGFEVDKVALRQVFPRVLRFCPVNFIPPVLHYTEKRKQIIFITGLHNKPQGWGASVASAAGPFTKRMPRKVICSWYVNIHSLRSLPCDRSIAYSKASSPESPI
jgi:hypothetical protein